MLLFALQHRLRTHMAVVSRKLYLITMTPLPTQLGPVQDIDPSIETFFLLEESDKHLKFVHLLIIT